MTEWWEEVIGSRLCHMCGASYKLYHDGGYHECGHPERDLMWKYKQHVPCKMAPVSIKCSAWSREYRFSWGKP